MRILVTYMLFLVLLCSCSGRRDSRLAEADRVMEEHPDSALAILEAIDTALLKGEDNRALHALLLSYASFKNYDVPLNDTLLDVAVNHYSRQLNSAELMKSMFLKAINGIERGEYESAMGLLLQAEKISKLRQNTYWQAKIVEREADVLSKSFNFEQAARSYKKAAELYKQAGRIDNHRFSLVDHARTAGNMNRCDYAFRILDSVYVIAEKENNLTLKRACVTAKFPLLVDDGRDSDAKHLYYDYPEEETKYLQNSLDLSRVARILMNEGNFSKAHEYLKIGDSLIVSGSDSMSMYYAWRDYYRHTGNLPQTLAYSDTLLEEIAKSEYSIMGQSAIGQQRDYYEGIYEAEVQRVQTQRIIIIGSIILFLVILTGGIMLHRYRMRLKASQLSDLGNNIRILRRDLEETEERATAEKMEMFTNQWRVIDSLCISYFGNGGDNETVALKRVTNQVASLIKKMENGEFYKNLEEEVNKRHDNLFKKIREAIPNKNESSYHMLLLMISGFSARSTSLLCGIEIELYYTRRSRLLKEVNEKLATQWPKAAEEVRKLTMKKTKGSKKNDLFSL